MNVTNKTTPISAVPDYALFKARTANGVGWFAKLDAKTYILDVELSDLLKLSAEEFESYLVSVSRSGRLHAVSDLELLAPIDDSTELWAAGVTYEASRVARMEESEEAADIYDLVYDAERPELFFKANGWRVNGPFGPAGIRRDSKWDVPEPEVALVLNSSGAVVGYTICNDMSSRSIEGENPLYLPQAKVYRHCATLGPWIIPATRIADPRNLEIRCTIRRSGDELWSGATSTARMKRTFPELAEHLFRADTYPGGAILSTGTAAVPGQDVTLRDGDVVTISVAEIGELVNTVVSV